MPFQRHKIFLLLILNKTLIFFLGNIISGKLKIPFKNHFSVHPWLVRDIQNMTSEECRKWNGGALLCLQGPVRFKISTSAFWFIYCLTFFIKRNCLDLCFLPINLHLANKMSEKDWLCCLQVSNNFYKWIYKARYILLNVYWNALYQRGLSNEQRIWTEKIFFYIL